ncbi:MAG: hypothetical protein KDD83_11700 [Caldilineaceae bacterium]|nr:hypothetical protein [Caldilineaceae bacterium]
MTTSALDATIHTLATQFSAAFPPQLDGPRTIGREAEFPVVNNRGEAADVRRLWDALMAPGDLTPKFEPTATPGHEFIVALHGADFSYALEVGVGTVELNTRPCRTLFELQAIQERGMERLARAAARYDWRVLGYGIQPVTPPSLRIMAPKQRYMSLYRAMGRQWLWYTVTASDQVQIDVARPEMVDLLNFGNLMTPVIIALCGNSPIFGGKPSPYCSAREGEMANIYTLEHRHGMPPRPVRDIADYVATTAETTYLIVRGDHEIYPSSRPFSAYLEEHGADYAAFLFHEHYMWNSARLRTAYATIEIRPACQQPWREHMAVSALGLGLIEAAPAIHAFVKEELGPDYWAVMQDYHALAIRHGLRAPQPAVDFLPRIVDMAHAGLAARGFGEEHLLEPLYNRLARGMNPAQRIRAVYRTDGLRGLVNHATVPPVLTASPPRFVTRLASA